MMKEILVAGSVLLFAVGCGAQVEDDALTEEAPSAKTEAPLKSAVDPGGGTGGTSGGTLRPPTTCESNCAAAGHANPGWCTSYCFCREVAKGTPRECSDFASSEKIDL